MAGGAVVARPKSIAPRPASGAFCRPAVHFARRDGRQARLRKDVEKNARDRERRNRHSKW